MSKYTLKEMSKASKISTAMLGFIFNNQIQVSAKIAQRISKLTGEPWDGYCLGKKKGSTIKREIIKAMEKQS